MRFVWVLLLMVLCWFVAEGARQKEPLKSNFRVGEDIKRNEPQYTRRTALAQNDREQAQNEQSGKMVDVSGYNFESTVLNSNKDVFIEFYVAWCPHCRNIMPVLDEVAELYQGKKDFLMARLNSNKFNDVAQRYGVSGFPTMILFRKGDTQGELYKGKRDVESFVTWLTARIGPPPDKLSIEQQGRASASVKEEEAKEKTERAGTVKEEEVRKDAEQKAEEKTEEKEEDEDEEAVVKQDTKEEMATWEDEGQGDDDQLLQKRNRAYSFKTKEEELKDRIKEVQMAVMEAARNMAAKANQQPLESPPHENNESPTIQSSAPVNQANQDSQPEALPTTMSEPSGLPSSAFARFFFVDVFFNVEKNGVQLFYRSWTRQRAKGAIILVHDVGSHSGRYEDLYSTLFFSGYSIYLYDLRGHGRSPGQRGHVEDWLHFRSDLHTFVELVHKQLNNKAKHNANKHHSKSEVNVASAVPLPLFLMGHGVGGTIVADYVLHSSTRVSGLALFSPCLHSPANSSVVQEWTTYTMSMLWPTYNWNWRTGAVVEELLVDEVDPLSHSLVSARLDAELREAEKGIHGRVSRLALPLFLTVAKEEAVEKREGIQHLYESVPNKEQTVVLRWYDGNGDYLFTETPSIFSSDLERWLQELSGASS